jgi:hypothetical protein
MTATTTTSYRKTTNYAQMLRGEISDRTGFDRDCQFASEKEVRSYFTAADQEDMFGEDAITDASILRKYAQAVIDNRWHCDF